VTYFDQIKVGSPSGAQALGTRLVTAGEGPVLLLNTDPVNPCYLSDSNSFVSSDQYGVSPLTPGGSVVFDGTIDVYGFTAPGVVLTVNSYPRAISYTNTTQTVQIASPSTFTTGGGTIPMSGQVTTPFIPVAQFASYDIGLTFTSNSNTSLVISVEFIWSEDPAGQNIVFSEEFWVPVYIVPAGTTTVTGSGPMHGNYLSILLTNPDTSAANISVFNLFGSSRPQNYSDWRSTGRIAMQNPTYNNVPSGDGFDNLLGAVSGQTVAAGATLNFALGMYAGPVWFRAQNTGASTSTTKAGLFTVFDNIPFALYNPNAGIASSAEQSQELILPRTFCFMKFQNIGTTAASMNATVTAQQAA
jgi:hypothetical protein